MASSPGCIRNGLACLPAAGYPRGLRGLSGGGFAQLLSCFGEATCTQRCRFLFSCHQNFAVKRRLCLGHLPSLPTCVSESMHSLMVMFLAGMPAYAITVASTHSCPSSPAMFVWSPCGTQPGGSCTLLLSTCVYKLHTHTHWDECFSPGCMAVKHWHCCAAAASGVRSSRCHSCGNKTG